MKGVRASKKERKRLKKGKRAETVRPYDVILSSMQHEESSLLIDSIPQKVKTVVLNSYLE